MIKLPIFAKHLSNPVGLRKVEFSYINAPNQTLAQWQQNLSLMPVTEQYHQITQVLSEVLVSNITDEKRMDMMIELRSSIRRIVSQLHSKYVYETSNLSKEQMVSVDRVKSIHFLCALIYDGILKRQKIGSDKYNKSNFNFKILRSPVLLQNNTTQQAIFYLMLCYLDLLKEETLIFEKVSDIIWQQLNYLYLSSIQENIASSKTRNKYNTGDDTDTIHSYYLQACLYSLLKPESYRRRDILSLHKVLEKWSNYITLGSDAHSESKLFIDLNSKCPPEYLTPYSKVNPYDKTNICIFIHITHLLDYLAEVQDKNSPNYKPSFEVRLAKLAEYTLHQQQFRLRTEKRQPNNEKAILVIGLHHIHYYLSGEKSFGNFINQADLNPKFHTKFRASLDYKDDEQYIPITLLDKSVSGYRFKIVEEDNLNEGIVDALDSPHNKKYNSLLKILSIFALMPNPEKPDSKWHLAMVRWIDHQKDGVQAGARIMGHSITACGVRLNGKDDRGHDFVPALLVAGDEKLETRTSLLLPHYHFKVEDKVILRIGNEEIKLRLSANLENTDDMQQYEIVRLSS